MALDQALIDLLVCPEDHGSLFYLGDDIGLYNPRLQRVYRVVDEIPVMLIDEADAVDTAEHDRLMALVTEGKASETGPK